MAESDQAEEELHSASVRASRVLSQIRLASKGKRQHQSIPGHTAPSNT